VLKPQTLQAGEHVEAPRAGRHRDRIAGEIAGKEFGTVVVGAQPDVQERVIRGASEDVHPTSVHRDSGWIPR
jgi:hypothetical protein